MTQAVPYKDQSWSFLGPTNVSGRIADVAVADYPTFRRLYAGSCCGGLWLSDDLGQTWRPVFEHEASTAIGDIAVAPSNPDIVWVGTGENNISAARTRAPASTSPPTARRRGSHGPRGHAAPSAASSSIRRIPNIVYVAAAGHVWTARSAGSTRRPTAARPGRKSLYDQPQTGVVDLAMDPSDPNTLYAATWQRCAAGATRAPRRASGKRRLQDDRRRQDVDAARRAACRRAAFAQAASASTSRGRIRTSSTRSSTTTGASVKAPGRTRAIRTAC